jgi:hypothetical protein
MSYSISTLLTRDLYDVFGDRLIDRKRRHRVSGSWGTDAF